VGGKEGCAGGRGCKILLLLKKKLYIASYPDLTVHSSPPSRFPKFRTNSSRFCKILYIPLKVSFPRSLISQ